MADADDGPGSRGALARARRRLTRLWFERGSLEDTYGDVDLRRFGLADPDRQGYFPSAWRHLERALDGERIGGADVFLDLGCGMGRVVYQAARMPFGRVIGVEISSELLEVARRNVKRNRGRLACAHVELVAADATTYEVPDDVTHVYMYNPFVGDAFRMALGQVIRSLDRRPRRLLLIYVNPVMAEAVEESERFRLLRTVAGRRHAPIALYEGSGRAAD
jgi:SAM-dependent methyltransferase